MAGIAYGAPYVPPVPAGDPWVGMPLTWTGWDGSVWDICDRASGVVLLSGARGFGMPPMQHWRSRSPAVPGARHRGAVADSREVFWPLKVWHDQGSREWVERDRAFWRTLDPQKTGVWTVAHPDGHKRSVTLRLEDDGDPSFDTIPSLVGWARYGVKLVADDPFWRGETVQRSWAAGSSADFFNSAARAPAFRISSANALGTAAITNPGDVEAYLTWTVHGLATSVTVGVNGSVVTAPLTVAARQKLVIETDPSVQAAFLDGVDVTDGLTAAEFAALPPGEDVNLSLALAGTGYVEASFTPRWYRAW